MARFAMSAGVAYAASASGAFTVGSGMTAAVMVGTSAPVTFAEVSGADLGAYVDPAGAFTQRCIRATNAALPDYTVFFRRDASGRREVVFELGRLFGNPTPANLPAHTVQIADNGAVLATISVPQHWYRARWRWQESPRPIRTTVAALMAGGRLPNYQASALHGHVPSLPGVFSYSPMTLAGIYPSMGATGERPDIGPVTDWQAAWMLTGNAGMQSTMLAQAEGSGTLPWHMRDENTGAPIDILAYPTSTMYAPNGANPYIAPATGTGIVLDPAHEPALAYLPFMLTGDPYYLEELQFAATYNFLSNPFAGRYPAANAHWGLNGATRNCAWSLRCLMQLATVTPASVPSWLKPQSYWQGLLNAERDYFLSSKCVAATSGPAATFQTADINFGSQADGGYPAGCLISPWQEDFLAFVMAWTVAMGHTDWAPIVAWKAAQTVARTNGMSGWVRAECAPYRIGLRDSTTSAWYPDWPTAWAHNLAVQGNTNLPFSDPNTLAGGQTYPQYARGVLALAKDQAVTGADACWQWLDGQIATYPTVSMYFKWAVAP